MANTAMKQPHGTQVTIAFGVLTVACLLLSSCGALPGGILSSPGPSPIPSPPARPRPVSRSTFLSMFLREHLRERKSSSTSWMR